MTLNTQGRRVSQAPLEIRLAGPGVDDGTASARAVASTLVAAADLVHALSSVEGFRGHGAPELKIEASKEGSFELILYLEAFGEWWAAMRSALTGDDAAAASNLITYAGVIGGLMALFKKLGKRKVREVQPREDGDVNVVTEDGEVIHTTPDVAQASTKRRARRAAKNLADSASFLGIDTVTINVGTINVTVNGAEAQNFPDPAPDEPDLEAEFYHAYATFRVPDFGGDVWTAETSRGPVRAKITDEDFLQRVAAGANVNKYAEYKITVHEEPRLTNGGNVVIDKTITKVRELHDGPRRALPDDTGEGEL